MKGRLVAEMKNARDLIAKSQAFISNLVRFTGHQMRQVYHRQIPSQTPLDRPERFDSGWVDPSEAGITLNVSTGEVAPCGTEGKRSPGNAEVGCNEL